MRRSARISVPPPLVRRLMVPLCVPRCASAQMPSGAASPLYSSREYSNRCGGAAGSAAIQRMPCAEVAFLPPHAAGHSCRRAERTAAAAAASYAGRSR